MRRTTAATTLFVLFMALIMASPASAAAAKFHSTSSSVSNTGALLVSFDQRGLGDTPEIIYTLTADATATYACFNGGGKNPQAANKQTNPGDVTADFTANPKNGRVVDTVAAGPISVGDFSCPGGQRLRLASVSYTNIVLTDTTNNVSIDVDDASRTFFAV